MIHAIATWCMTELAGLPGRLGTPLDPPALEPYGSKTMRGRQSGPVKGCTVV
jgi:hypothetical protein